MTPEPIRPDFAAVVQEHWLSVFRLLQTLSGNLHLTEDLTQETFLRALNRWDRFEPGTNLRAWLFRIAANAHLDHCRRARTAKNVPLEVDRPGSEPDPGFDLELAERAELARAALNELTELTRMVFHLRVTEDLSFREIAEIAGTTEQSARWHMHNARVKLLERLGKDF